jgi:hypothetical protein
MTERAESITFSFLKDKIKQIRKNANRLLGEKKAPKYVVLLLEKGIG